jgi:rhomboid domain-containing protein 1
MYRQRNNQLGLLLLISHISSIGLENIPPTTLFFLIINTIIYYLDPLLLNLNEVCILPYKIIFHNEWKRLFLASFYHVDDIHLYYNMISLIWKGRFLEPILNTKRFAIVIIILGVLSNFLLVGISFLLFYFTKNEEIIYTCSIGFSSILFALKVIITNLTPNTPTSFLGITMESKYIYWAELLFIQIITPNASFFGHLCGILSGLLYTNGYLSFIFNLLDLNFSYPTNHYHERDIYSRGRRQIRNGVLF